MCEKLNVNVYTGLTGWTASDMDLSVCTQDKNK